MNKILNYTFKIAKAIPALNTHLSSNYSTKVENKFQNQVYSVSNIILTSEVIEVYLQKFWDDIMNQLTKNQHVSLLLKIRFTDNQTKTLTTRQEINKDSFKDLLDLIVERISYTSEGYTSIPISDLIFFYRINDGAITPKLTSNKKSVPNYQIFYKNKLPIGYKPEDYGDIIHKMGDSFAIAYGKSQIYLDKSSNGNEIIHNIKLMKNNKVVFTWIDK